MSKNRDKESDKEIANAQKDRIAKGKEFGLGPEDMVQEVIEKIVEVSVDNPELTNDLKKAVLNLQEANDLLEFKDDQIKAFEAAVAQCAVQIKTYKEQLEVATAQLVDSEEVYTENISLVAKNEVAEKALAAWKTQQADSTKIIKGLEAKNLKLKEAVKQLSE